MIVHVSYNVKSCVDCPYLGICSLSNVVLYSCTWMNMYILQGLREVHPYGCPLFKINGLDRVASKLGVSRRSGYLSGYWRKSVVF